MKIENQIDKYFIDGFKIDTEKDYKVIYKNGKDLIVSKRIDLVAKILYINSILKKLDTDYFESLYKGTIEAFSDGNYNEPGNDQKNSFEKYKEAFIKLYNNIKENGFDINKSIIPIDSNGSIIDGGHRSAIAAYTNMEIPCIKIDNANINYDLSFFKEKLLDPEYLDYLCFEYSKLRDNVYVICLWPILDEKNRNKSIEIIRNSLNVIYEKNVKFNYNGLRNFMIEIYGHQSWIGTPENRYSGVDDKVSNCFNESNYLTCIFVEDDIEKVLDIKARVRDMVKIGNHSIHSTDNHNETIDMASLILNNNSINFLNNGNPSKYPNMIKKIKMFKDELIKANVNLNDVIIDSGTVLSMYGLRENNDIDFLINEHVSNKLPNTIDNHNEYKQFFSTSIDDMLFNPQNHYYYFGLKFLKLDLVKKMKINRINSNKIGEHDIEDVEIINKSKNIKCSNFYFQKIKLKIKKIKRYMKKYIKTILIKLRLFNLVKKILKR